MWYTKEKSKDWSDGNDFSNHGESREKAFRDS